MKCFICGSTCITEYIKRDYNTDVIIAVQKVCKYEACGWKSYPTKIPKSIKDHN
jgi:hypothetical protein